MDFQLKETNIGGKTMDVYSKNNSLIVDLCENIDIGNQDTIKKHIYIKFMETPNCKEILIDCKKCEYIDSSGLGAIIYLQNAALKRNVSIKIVNVKPQIKKIFETTKLGLIIDIIDGEFDIESL